MNTNTNNLGLEDWQRYKQSGPGNYVAEKNISGSDLNYLASKGFEKAGITAADVNDVYKRIHTKTYTAINLNAVFIGGIVVVAFVTAFFFLSNTQKNNTANTSPAKNNSELEEKITTSPLNNLPEKIAEPPVAEPKKTTPWNKEHFSIKNIEQIYDEKKTDSEIYHDTKEEIEDMQVKPVTSVSVENYSELNFNQLPNAPIVYLRNLKITNFTLYYRKNNQKFVINNGGIDAQFPDVISYKDNKVEMKEGGIRTTADDVLLEAVDAFEAQNYSACIQNFDVLLKLNRADVNALFYSGLCHYNLGNYTRAITCLSEVIDNRNNIFDQEAEYYKALSLMASSQKYEATEILKRIVNEKGFYAERALEILKKKN